MIGLMAGAVASSVGSNIVERGKAARLAALEEVKAQADFERRSQLQTSQNEFAAGENAKNRTQDQSQFDARLAASGEIIDTVDGPARVNGTTVNPLRMADGEGVRRRPEPPSPSNYRNVTDATTGETVAMDVTSQSFGEGVAAGRYSLAGTGPQVAIDMGETQSAFDEKAAEIQAASLSEMMAEGTKASETIGDLRSLAELASRIDTGAGAQVKARLGPYAQSLGIEIDGLDDIQAMRAIVSRMAPAMRTPGSGASSDRDVEMFLNALPSLANSPEGNRVINQTLSAVAEWKKSRGQIATKAITKEITYEDALRQIEALPDPYSLWKETSGQAPTTSLGPPPEGVSASEWQFMTEDERAIFR
ncbi:MAG: hypothetical protein AAF449_00775 [Myxococcota bacterium]